MPLVQNPPKGRFQRYLGLVISSDPQGPMLDRQLKMTDVKEGKRPKQRLPSFLYFILFAVITG